MAIADGVDAPAAAVAASIAGPDRRVRRPRHRKNRKPQNPRARCSKSCSEGEYLEVRGENLASLIGKHGNTLEALNLIFNNILNAGVRNNRRYYTIDAEGYRARKADQLKTLALATLERVIREGKAIKLEPMLPSERKIVHLALSESSVVRTESEGVDPDRRLVVSPK